MKKRDPKTVFYKSESYSGVEIDDFYRQLKVEMENGWIEEPEKAWMIEKEEPSDTMEAA